jgi:hypothetical protein
MSKLHNLFSKVVEAFVVQNSFVEKEGGDFFIYISTTMSLVFCTIS